MPVDLWRMEPQQSVVHTWKYIITDDGHPAFNALRAQVPGETGHQIVWVTHDRAADDTGQFQVSCRQPHVEFRLPAAPDQDCRKRIGRSVLLARRILTGAVHDEVRQPEDIAHSIEGPRPALPDKQMVVATRRHRLIHPRPARAILLGSEEAGGCVAAHEVRRRRSLAHHDMNSSSNRLNRSV